MCASKFYIIARYSRKKSTSGGHVIPEPAIHTLNPGKNLRHVSTQASNTFVNVIKTNIHKPNLHPKNIPNLISILKIYLP